MAKKKKSKIVSYRRPLNINVGVIIFAMIFIYIAFSIYTYMKKEKVQFFEVVEGNIVNDTAYTGLILRDETVQRTDYAGYINYYIREGKRAAVGTRIYSIDEMGSIAAYREENPEANVTLTDRNISDIRRQLTAFSRGYTDRNFGEVYSLQYSLEAAVLEFVNFNALDNLDMLQEQFGNTFQQVRAPKSGVVSYSIDGYEELELSQISMERFDRSNYAKAITKAGQRIEQGVPVYKLITSDDWNIVFALSDEEAAKYAEHKRLKIRFPTNDLETEAEFSVMTGSDGKQYGKLDFTQYMIQFVSERFVNFEIKTENADGLKIPASAITTKNFYLVPVEFQTQDEETGSVGFMKETYSENGTSVEFISATIYYSTEEYVYIDMGERGVLQAGDYVVRPDSQERYQIGSSASLQGVYNINKGYAVFKQIEILNTNEEYYTIRKGTSYGLSVYDHIVLNAGTVYEGELIYQ